ncbi:MAG: type II toxin-antitoxin system VapC family toxin [Planctomycetaceae bacterium]|nr:type II toxin-antitoxin system VapC family toxin [Planctomycetaceae bacterium]MBV8266878.1 type II toxin-antitoxin system VapC family toxin [Planctomycetaceae bacterium]
MRLLLDTHAFLWFILADPKMSAAALNLITDPANQKQISPASYWEIAIKIRLGKYSLPSPYETFMRQQHLRNNFAILQIAVSHTAVLTTLPLHHRDPFDRLLVAQAMVEDIPLVSGDPALDAYPIIRLW